MSPFSESVAENILDLIGNTPMVRLGKIVEPGMARVLAKLESFNPGGSVKDRICKRTIEEAEREGRLIPGSTIIEPTSGNTGIGLAMISAVKGYKCVLVLPETMSLERIYILRSYGAEVVLTPGAEGMEGAIKKAEEIHRRTPASFMPRQFTNRFNPDEHRKSTAKEILSAAGPDISAFVAGVGTGGTITGVGEVLKRKNPGIKIIAVEPKTSAVLSGGKRGPHKIQGIGAGFVPEILNTGIIDSVVAVDDMDAFGMAKRLAREEGIFVGISSGAACYGALKAAGEIGPGGTVVTLFPDLGERYFSMERYFET
ncbi:MAG: cysteine synthase A [Candidatus Omnitrophica bacterium]|nr:cysteine synthase A [Candidatus Omnitrophota bacterium]